MNRLEQLIHLREELSERRTAFHHINPQTVGTDPISKVVEHANDVDHHGLVGIPFYYARVHRSSKAQEPRLIQVVTCSYRSSSYCGGAGLNEAEPWLFIRRLFDVLTRSRLVHLFASEGEDVGIMKNYRARPARNPDSLEPLPVTVEVARPAGGTSFFSPSPTLAIILAGDLVDRVPRHLLGSPVMHGVDEELRRAGLPLNGRLPTIIKPPVRGALQQWQSALNEHARRAYGYMKYVSLSSSPPAVAVQLCDVLELANDDFYREKTGADDLGMVTLAPFDIESFLLRQSSPHKTR